MMAREDSERFIEAMSAWLQKANLERRPPVMVMCLIAEKIELGKPVADFFWQWLETGVQPGTSPDAIQVLD